MSDRYVEILRDSRQSWNDIPAGRQLLRTPPMTLVKQQLHFCTEDSSEEQVEPQLDMEADTTVEDDNDQNVTFNYNAITPKTEPEESNTMLKGMKGCQLTQNDLEFMEKMKEDKLIKQLQGDLKEVQRLLRKEEMQLELALASRERAQADQKLPSFEDLIEWGKEVRSMTSPSTQLADLDLDSFLDTVTKETVEKATEEKRIQIPRMQNMLAKKEKREAKERGQLEKNVASQQLKVLGSMSQMSNLISELSQEEDAYKALEIRIKTQEEEAAGMEADKVAVKEEPQYLKVQAKTRGKGRAKAVTFQEPANSKTKSSKTDSGKHDKEKPTKSVKESKRPSSQEALQSVGGRRKKPAATKPKSGVKTEEAPSTTRREAPSTTRREAPSTTRREAPSTTRREAPSTTRQEAPSTTRQEAPSTNRQEAPSTTRQEAPSTTRHEAPPQGRKEETTVLRRSKRIASKSH